MAAAPFGSSLILPISYAYIALMGTEGLTEASKLAILKANYMAKRLSDAYPVLYTGKAGTCAHEFIMDVRPFKDTAGEWPQQLHVDIIGRRFGDAPCTVVMGDTLYQDNCLSCSCKRVFGAVHVLHVQAVAGKTFSTSAHTPSVMTCLQSFTSYVFLLQA